MYVLRDASTGAARGRGYAVGRDALKASRRITVRSGAVIHVWWANDTLTPKAHLATSMILDGDVYVSLTAEGQHARAKGEI